MKGEGKLKGEEGGRREVRAVTLSYVLIAYLAYITPIEDILRSHTLKYRINRGEASAIRHLPLLI